jgi:hypothetical protein
MQCLASLVGFPEADSKECDPRSKRKSDPSVFGPSGPGLQTWMAPPLWLACLMGHLFVVMWWPARLIVKRFMKAA